MDDCHICERLLVTSGKQGHYRLARLALRNHLRDTHRVNGNDPVEQVRSRLANRTVLVEAT